MMPSGMLYPANGCSRFIQVTSMSDTVSSTDSISSTSQASVAPLPVDDPNRSAMAGSMFSDAQTPAQAPSSGDGPPSDDTRPASAAGMAAGVAGERRLKAENLVKRHVIAAMPLGLVPIPVFDLAALTGNHLAMLKSLCRLYQHDCKASQVRALLASLIGAAIPVVAVSGLSSGAKLIPGIGTLIGSGSLAVTAGAVTYAIGQVYIQSSEQGSDLPQLDAKALRARFKQELERGKDVARGLRARTRANSGDPETAASSSGGEAPHEPQRA
jgi:uncharacterized protein (DUF697 family)